MLNRRRTSSNRRIAELLRFRGDFNAGPRGVLLVDLGELVFTYPPTAKNPQLKSTTVRLPAHGSYMEAGDRKLVFKAPPGFHPSTLVSGGVISGAIMGQRYLKEEKWKRQSNFSKKDFNIAFKEYTRKHLELTMVVASASVQVKSEEKTIKAKKNKKKKKKKKNKKKKEEEEKN